MPVIKVTGLQVIAIYCSDLEKSKSFYMDMLGFKEGEEMLPGVLLNAPGIIIYLEAGRKPREQAEMMFPEISPCLATGSIKAAFLKLKESGGKIVTDYIEYTPSFAMFRIADPDGNIIEFAGEP